MIMGFCFDHQQPYELGWMCPKCEDEVCAAHDNLPVAEMEVNGCPVVISATYVTGSEGDWMGSYHAGEYRNMKELNKAMPALIEGIPSKHWRLEIDFQDGRFE
jgi:hypothetical protein